MVGEVRLYVEGGGDQRDVKRQLERGMGQLLAPLRALARSRRIRWCIVAFEEIAHAMRTQRGIAIGQLRPKVAHHDRTRLRIEARGPRGVGRRPIFGHPARIARERQDFAASGRLIAHGKILFTE